MRNVVRWIVTGISGAVGGMIAVLMRLPPGNAILSPEEDKSPQTMGMGKGIF